MAMGRMRGARQEELFIAASAVGALDNPLYTALDKLLRKSGFGEIAEETCREFYASRMGRPGLPPGGVLPDADGGVPGGDRVGAGHRVAVQGLDLAAGVSGLRSGEDPAGEHSTLSKTRKAAEPGGARGSVRVGAGGAAGVGAAAGEDAGGGFDDAGGERGDARDRPGATTGRSTTRGSKSWRRRRGSRHRRATIWPGWTASARRRGRTRTGSIRTTRRRGSRR